MKNIFLIIMYLFCVQVFAQFFQPYTIKKSCSNQKYNKLFERYFAYDTSLSVRDYQILYYGQVFREHFQPYAMSLSLELLRCYRNFFNETCSYEQFNEMYEAEFRKYPLSLTLVQLMTYVLYHRKDTSLFPYWLDRYTEMLKAIKSTGDGQSTKTAYYGICISDNHAFMREFDMYPQLKQLLFDDGHVFDVFTEVKEGQERHMFFNISLFFGKGFQ